MSLLNVNLSILAYADGPASSTPLLRLADLKWSMSGLPTDNFRNIPLSLAPGETAKIASTARPLVYGQDTAVQTSSPNAGTLRISGNLGQRATRLILENESASITKTGDVARLTFATAVSTQNVLVGDGITIDSPFQFHNQGDFIVISKGYDYVEFLNPLAQPENATGKIRFYSSGPVQKGDILDISSNKFSYLNRVNASITRVNDEFIEVAAINCVTENVTGVSGGINIYPNAYKWLLIAVDRKAIVGLNGEEPTNIEIEPHIEGDLSKQPGLFMKRGKVFEVKIKNPGLTTLSGFVILSE